MTTYILAGGNDRGIDAYGLALAAEVSKRLDKSLNVLSCLFASPREDWEGKFPERVEWLKKTFGVDTHVVMALPKTLHEQVQASDLVYIHGGDDGLLDYYFGSMQDLRELFQGKIVVGSSAGANLLSANFWTCDWREARKGLELTSLNVIPHYESQTYGKDDPRGSIDWKRAEVELGNFVGDDAEVTPIREGELIVVEV